jgi:hypothetical protein
MIGIEAAVETSKELSWIIPHSIFPLFLFSPYHTTTPPLYWPNYSFYSIRQVAPVQIELQQRNNTSTTAGNCVQILNPQEIHNQNKNQQRKEDQSTIYINNYNKTQ